MGIEGRLPRFLINKKGTLEGLPLSLGPKFRHVANKDLVLDRPIFELGPEDLKAAFSGKGPTSDDSNAEHRYSRLEILHTLALGEVSHCRLCGWECGVNRFSEERGKCGLGSKLYGSDSFIHVAEEPVTNPALVTNLGDCGLRCIYCIDSKAWTPGNLSPLDLKCFWEEAQGLMMGGTPINTLEFTNPTELLPGIIGLLSQPPSNFNLPVVMNCHLYGSKVFYDLAGLVADVWLPDLRYGNDGCAKALSRVDRYIEHARLGLEAMVQQKARIIVRILVLPSHLSCFAMSPP